MKTNVKVLGVEKKTSKGGKEYHSVKTEQGVMTCWAEELVKTLTENIGKCICLEVEESGKFKNIRKFFGEAKETPSEHVKNDAITEARASKDISIYTSYAKDIFICLYSSAIIGGSPVIQPNIMKEAIDLVKQAKEGFK